MNRTNRIRWYRLDDTGVVSQLGEDENPTDDLIKPIAKNDVIDKDGCVVRVSTVFLSLNHSFTEEGDPILFETMVFSENEKYENFQERYSSITRALDRHQEIVRKVQLGEDLHERKIIKLKI